MSDISRRLLLKLVGATGATLAMPAVVQAAIPQSPESYPTFEYFDGSKWVELGGVFDVNVKVTAEYIEQGFGRPPIKGVATAETTVDYFFCDHDPFVGLNCPRVDIRIRLDCLGDKYRFECSRALAVEHILSSEGKVRVTLMSGGFPEMSLA